jgi:hypothetical protein
VFGDLRVISVQHEGEPWVPVETICEALGAKASTQLRMLRKRGWATLKVLVVPLPGGMRGMECIPASRLAVWLVNIETRHVAPGKRERLDALKCEAADALANHFVRRPAPVHPSDLRLAQFLAEEKLPAEERLALARSRLDIELARLFRRQPDELGEVHERVRLACGGEPTAKQLVSLQAIARVTSGPEAFWSDLDDLTSLLTPN